MNEQERKTCPFGLFSVIREDYDNIPNKWVYSYPSKGHLRRIKSPSLRNLRQMVEKAGLPWVVVDLQKASEAYNIDQQREEEKYRNKNARVRTGGYKVGISGVRYVNKHGDRWVYVAYRRDNTRKVYSAATLKKLRQRVTCLGFPWQVVDQDKYDQALIKEGEL